MKRLSTWRQLIAFAYVPVLLLSVAIPTQAYSQEYEIGGRLAGVKLPLYKTQHGSPPGIRAALSTRAGQGADAPIGKGLFKRGKTTFKSNSEWGDGEFLLMRTTFELEALDYDSYRISVLASQGFHVYLNGHRIHTYIWWKNMPHYRLIMLGPEEIKHLREGTNILAVYTNTEYPKGVPMGQIDLYLEGLKNGDLE